MSILLVCPPQKTVYGRPAFPRLGLAYLSGALFEQGIDHDIIDLSLHLNDWRKVLEVRLKDYASFGITSNTFEFNAAIQVARHIKAHAPDFILVDLMMEEIDAGRNMVKELQLLGNTAPVYMLTAAGDSLVVNMDYTELGLAGVFQKPINPDTLILTLKSKLGQ